MLSSTIARSTSEAAIFDPKSWISVPVALLSSGWNPSFADGSGWKVRSEDELEVGGGSFSSTGVSFISLGSSGEAVTEVMVEGSDTRGMTVEASAFDVQLEF